MVKLKLYNLFFHLISLTFKQDATNYSVFLLGSLYRILCVVPVRITPKKRTIYVIYIYILVFDRSLIRLYAYHNSETNNNEFVSRHRFDCFMF